MRHELWRRIDWRVALGLPPKRRFSAEELARTQAGTISPTVAASVALNVSLPLAIGLWVLVGQDAWALSAVLVAFSAVLVGGGIAAWRDPSSTAMRWLYWMLPTGTGVLVGLTHSLQPQPRPALMLVWGEVLVGTLALWFCIVYRHHFIESRLRELAERDRAVEMAQRLASAQIEPHFLFNTLASLQHWVDVGDARAAPFLRSLTGYLRATLPMFGRPLQPLGDELAAVQRYLEVMQARLGHRLSWHVDVPAAMHGVELPPGALLTLVENAIEHGVEPTIRGGELRVSASLQGTVVRLAVLDDGPGPPAAAISADPTLAAAPGTPANGQGLANVRERLRLAFGDDARLTLAARATGGCEATLTWTLPPR